jgi:hypothetical protein
MSGGDIKEELSPRMPVLIRDTLESIGKVGLEILVGDVASEDMLVGGQ